MPVLADTHVHTTFSVDGKHDMYSMCRAAVDSGLRHICFTEHLDFNPDDIGYGFLDLSAYSLEIDRVRQEFGDRLEILKGIEFGEPHMYPQRFREAASMDFDVILAGFHWVDDRFIGDSELSHRYSVEELFEKYYEGVLDTVRFGGFDVLAHLDLPKRYLGVSVESSPLLEEILKALVASGIALEINTSPMRKGCSECSPDRSILQRYVAAGGSRVCVGSDAHSCEDIAAHFDSAERLLEQIGVQSSWFFRNRKYISLDNYR